MDNIVFDFPDELGGQVMDINYTIQDGKIVVNSSSVFIDPLDSIEPIPVDLSEPRWAAHKAYLIEVLQP